LGVQWYYNWSSTSTIQSDATFVPMIFSPKHVDEQVSGPEVMGFNEPDKAAQANVTVDEALAAWPAVVAKADRVGAPAVAGNPVTGTWFPEFMAAQPKVDFVTVHWYKGVDASKFESDIQAVIDAYHRPVWVTEFAPQTKSDSAARPKRYSRKHVNEFIAETVAWMEAQPMVERYAWHDSTVGRSSLFNTDGTLNATGRAYAAAH
jgi:hypothetical protein